MKYLVFGILFSILGFGVSNAQERGIGVTPAEIEITGQVDWPYTVAMTVTNFSAGEEQFEVLFDKDNDVVVSATPARFSLDGGKSGRVMVTFEEPRQFTEGLVKVLSTKTSAEGFTTGTGVKIPFRIRGFDDSAFLASASEAGSVFPYIFGTGVIIISLIFLWYIAGVIKSWLVISSKQ